MYSLFLGAGFPKWAVNLPVVDKLFDFNIEIFNKTDDKRMRALRSIKLNWDKKHPKENNEQFIAYAVQLPEQQKQIVLWYISRRLAEPFIWNEFHSFRWRRHVLMIDENRRFQIEGLSKARDFLYRYSGFSISGIITTNYDMVIEYALGTTGFNYGIKDEILQGRGPYPVSTWRNPVKLTGKIELAKIHGSISWDEHGHYTNGRRGITGDALIVAPTLEKHVPQSIRYVWQLAREILEQSTKLLVFGFAFNPYDQSVLDLLRSSGKNIKSVLIVDIEPKMDIPSIIWPQAYISSCQPPPESNSVINDWMQSF